MYKSFGFSLEFFLRAVRSADSRAMIPAAIISCAMRQGVLFVRLRLHRDFDLPYHSITAWFVSDGVHTEDDTVGTVPTSAWKTCRQGNRHSRSPSAYSPKHTMHDESVDQSSESEPPASPLAGLASSGPSFPARSHLLPSLPPSTTSKVLPLGSLSPCCCSCSCGWG